MNCIFQGHQDDTGYRVAIPGSEIPKWFSHQNVGDSVNLQVPSDLLGNKLLGIAACVVFVFRKHHPIYQLHIQDNRDIIGTHYLWCSVGGSRLAGHILFEKYGMTELYKLLIEYFPSTYLEAAWKEILNKVDPNGFSQIEVKFEPFGLGLEVTKCGAHLVFEQDIEDLINQTKAGPSSCINLINQTKAGPSSCIITPYDEDGFEDSEKDTKIKRNSDDSVGEGARSTSNDEPPHLKWIRHPDLIENWFGNSHA